MRRGFIWLCAGALYMGLALGLCLVAGDSSRASREGEPGSGVQTDSTIPFTTKVATHAAEAHVDEQGRFVVKCIGDDPHVWGFLEFTSRDSAGALSEAEALVIRYESSKSGQMQIFFAQADFGFSEQASSWVEIEKTTSDRSAEVRVPIKKGRDGKGPITDVRFDPPNGATLKVIGVKALRTDEFVLEIVANLSHDIRNIKETLSVRERDSSRPFRSAITIPLATRAQTHNMNADLDESGRLLAESKGDDPYLWGFLDLEALDETALREATALSIIYESSSGGLMEVFFAVSDAGFRQESATSVSITKTADGQSGRVLVPINKDRYEHEPIRDVRLDPPDDSAITLCRVEAVFSLDYVVRRLTELSEGGFPVKGLTNVKQAASSWTQAWTHLPPGRSIGALLSERIARFRSEQRLADAAVLHLTKRLAQLEGSGKRSPNIVLIVPDALNGGYLSCFEPEDGPVAMTPHLDALASDSLYFRNAVCQGGQTPHSMTSIHTGLYPYQHGVTQEAPEPHRLAPDMRTIPELLSSEGYFTAAFVSVFNSGLFDHLLDDYDFVHTSADPKGEESIQAVIDFLGKRPPQPFFIFLHIFDPHAWYEPVSQPIFPESLARRMADFSLKQRSVVVGEAPCGLFPVSRIRELLYIREIEELDARLGRLFEYLRKSPSDRFDWDRDVVVFTSDHGEEFEHQNGFYSHGRSASIEAIRVPLMVRAPQVKADRLNTYVGNTGIFPMILGLLGIDDPRPGDLVYEIDLLAVNRRHGAGNGHTYTFCESTGVDRTVVPGSHEQKTIVRSDGYKLIFDTATHECRLFYLPHDPGEDNDIAHRAASKAIVEELKKELAERTDLSYDYPVGPGTYVGHAVPPPHIQKLFGPPLDVVRKFGTPEELEKYELKKAK